MSAGMLFLTLVVLVPGVMAPATAQCEPTWTRADPIGPIPPLNNYPAMAFDESRGEAVTFGGQYPGPGQGWSNETWEWNGTSWSHFQSGRLLPMARAWHGMTYEVLAQRVTIFGGRVAGPIYDMNDTQQFDGNSWEVVWTGGPSPRLGVAMAYDRNRNRVVLWGGSDQFSSNLADTWEWAGNGWSLKATTGPPPRQSMGAAWDPNSGQVIVYGGDRRVSGTTVYYDDTWGWNGSTWTLLSSTGPGARCCMSMAYDPEAGGVLLFGGLGPTGDLRDTWFWDGEQWSPVPIAGNSPQSRSSAAMTADTTRNEILLFAGSGSSGWFNDLWRFEHGLAIVRHPHSQSLPASGLVRFSARAISDGPVSYHWRKDGEFLVDGPTPSGSTLSGTQTNVLTIDDVNEVDLGSYDCVVTNDCNSLTTTAALLTQTWYLDADGDGFGDVASFIRDVTPPFGYVLDETDCDDSDPTVYPGAPEFCDGIDQDCDFALDNAPPATSRPKLDLTALGAIAHLSWSIGPTATFYDVIRGDLLVLHSSAGDFSTATDVCLADDLFATTLSDSDPVFPGEGVWYLLRSANCAGGGSYDDGSPGLASARDPGIAASTQACP